MSISNNYSFSLRAGLYHLLYWLIYIASEYLANYFHLQGAEHGQMLISTFYSLPILLIPTYAIIYYAIPNLLKKGKTVLFLIFIIAAAAFVIMGRVQWLELINSIFYDFNSPMPVTKVLKNVVRDCSIIVLAVSLHIIADWRKKEKENKKLLEAKTKNELELLKRQLHPHFLFNTLNNIYSLSVKNAPETSDSILKLSQLLEYLVYQSGNKFVLIKDEIELVKNYIELEQLRYGTELQLNFEADGDYKNIKTAPLLLLPFVENCFKHGGKNKVGKFWINIRFAFNEDLLVASIENSKPFLKKKRLKHKDGVGLTNIQDRLELLYKNRYNLIMEENTDYFSIRFELNLQ